MKIHPYTLFPPVKMAGKENVEVYQYYLISHSQNGGKNLKVYPYTLFSTIKMAKKKNAEVYPNTLLPILKMAENVEGYPYTLCPILKTVDKTIHLISNC